MSTEGCVGRVTQAFAVGFLLAGCATSHVENGTFNSTKGYHVRLPPAGWSVTANSAADLELRRTVPPGAMLVDASCGGAEIDRSLRVLARHLTIGLTNRQTVESDTWTIGDRTAAHRVIRGRSDGADVMVEAVVLKGEHCVHDFLFVAPPDEFENGRQDFKLLVESFAGDRR
jgi:hypothetical protein